MSDATDSMVRDLVVALLLGLSLCCGCGAEPGFAIVSSDAGTPVDARVADVYSVDPDAEPDRPELAEIGAECNRHADCASNQCGRGTCQPAPIHCDGFLLDRPAKNGEPLANGTWYGVNWVRILPGERRVYCAPALAPFVPEQPTRVDFSLWSERSQQCGSARLTVVPPSPNQPVKTDHPGYYTLVHYSAAYGRDPLAYPERAARGVYRIVVEVGFDPAGCYDWEIGWRAIW